MPTIVFVCTANRYRSPIAAACFRRELDLNKGRSEWQVLSAGTWAVDGMPAAAEAIRQAGNMGLDIANHRSHLITPELMKTADLVIVMEPGHKEALQAEFPQEARKIYLLSEAAAGQTYNIPDPVGLAEVQAVPREISELIHDGFERMCALVKE